MAKYQRDNKNDFIAPERQFFSAQSQQQRLPKSTSNPVNCGPAVEQVNASSARTRSTIGTVSTRERFETTARHFEAGARDEPQPETARVNVESQYDTNTRIHHMETQAKSILLQHQMSLISQLASEATQALESQCDNLTSEASTELSRSREQVQHLHAELQVQAVYHTSEIKQAAALSQQTWDTIQQENEQFRSPF